MVNESCIFHFKNPNGKDFFLSEDEIKIILGVVGERKLKTKGITLEIDQELYTEFETIIESKEGVIVENIIIDIISGFHPSALDNIFNLLYTAISGNHNQLHSIVIVGASSSITNLRSLFDFLGPHCRNNKIGLISINKGNVLEIFELGNLPTSLTFPELKSLHVQSYEIIPTIDTFDIAFIKSNLEYFTKFLYGHFHIKYSNVDFHTNGVLSISKCLDNESFILNFKNYIRSFFNTEKIKILTICIEESGIDDLAKRLESDDIEVFNPNEKYLNESFNLLVFSDFLSANNKANEIIPFIREKYKINRVKSLGISKYKNYSPIDEDCLIDCDFSEFNSLKKDCSYCNHDSIAITGANFTNFRKSILEFDTFSFWEFIKMSSAYYSIEHYPSKRTLNHFDFRIICEGLFRKHSYSIVNRLINLANKNGVFSSWIHKTLYTTDQELSPLINDFADILDIKDKYRIEIKREFIDAISADNPGEKVEDLFLNMRTKLGHEVKEWNLKNNVIIIDQAAHNFKTLSALGSICKKYNLTLLSIALFINRADPISTRLFIENFHLLSLYSWPVRPNKFNVCFCKKPDA